MLSNVWDAFFKYLFKKIILCCNPLVQHDQWDEILKQIQLGERLKIGSSLYREKRNTLGNVLKATGISKWAVWLKYNFKNDELVFYWSKSVLKC